MRARVRDHVRGNVVAYVALFFAFGGTSAYASHLVVRSSDIVNDEVRTADVRNDNLRGGGLRSIDVAPGALTGGDIADSSLTGGDILGDSLTGGDIAESSLGTVPSARLGGRGRSASDGLCDPEGTTHINCVLTTLSLPAPARVLVTAATTVQPEGSDDGALGNCVLATSATGHIPGSSKFVAAEDEGGPFTNASEAYALTAVSPVQPAGTVHFGLDCNESSQDFRTEHTENQVSAVALTAE